MRCTSPFVMPYCFCCFLLLISALPTQRAHGQDVVGFRLGINVAGIEGDVQASEDFGTRVGLAAGLFGTIPLRHNFALQPELLYSQKGFTTDRALVGGTDPSVPLSASIELTYLELPLFLKYALPIGRSASLSIYAGPMLSFELAERLTIEGLQGSQGSDEFRSPETGIAVGTDLETSLFGVEGLIGLRYSRGIGNVLNEQARSSPERRLHNQAFSVFVGVHLR